MVFSGRGVQSDDVDTLHVEEVESGLIIIIVQSLFSSFSVAEEFSRMTSTRYTLEELSVESSLLPAHVDPSRLEDYLRTEEFVKVGPDRGC